MTPEVEAAIHEVKQVFPGHVVEVTPEPQGGAYVVVHDLSIGSQYAPTTTWIGFLITFQYPFADVYPHFVAPDLGRTDGTIHKAGITGPSPWNGRQALQVSRRSNHWSAATDTAALKLAKVLEWLRSQ